MPLAMGQLYRQPGKNNPDAALTPVNLVEKYFREIGMKIAV
jgi:hypothetical protein